MQQMGFELRENNEIETDFFNFTGLNIPENHPARQEQDTFYTEDDRLLRTHTSSVQVHVMNEQSPPIRIICPGRVFRNEQDKTHSPMFNQLECSSVNTSTCNVNFLVDTFSRVLKEIEIRLRPNFFPFTEPSMRWILNLMVSGLKFLVAAWYMVMFFASLMLKCLSRICIWCWH